MKLLSLICCICVYASAAFGVQKKSISLAPKYQKAALRSKLSEHPYWKKILYYQYIQTPFEGSIIDTSDFFLSAKGKKSAEAELQASIAAIFTAPKASMNDHHGQCKYPLRLHFIKQHLLIPDQELPKVNCYKLERFMRNYDFTSMSLVFTSFNADHTDTLLGDILFRLHKREDHQSWGPGLTDIALSFEAAQYPNQNIINDMKKGFFGGLDGKFNLKSYYQKIQEYPKYKYRNLWQYSLNLSSQQIKTLLLTVWEMGENTSNYYYLTENSSFMLTYILETARPDLQLISKLNYSATPADIVQIFHQAPGLITGFSFTPSNASRYQERLTRLEPEQRPLVASVIENPSNEKMSPLLKTLNRKTKGDVIDTALEWIDLNEHNVELKKHINYHEARQKLIATRAKIHRPSRPLNYTPLNQKPDRANPKSMYGLGFISNKINTFTKLNWRPAQSDLLGNATGLPKGTAISILDTEIRYDNQTKKAELERLDLIALTNLRSFSLDDRQVAYLLRAGARERFWREGDELYTEIAGALGIAHWLSAAKIRLWGLAGMQANMELETKSHGDFLTTFDAGILYRPEPKLRVILRGEWAQSIRSSRHLSQQRLYMGKDLMPLTEVRIGAVADASLGNSGEISLLRYF